MTTIIASLVIAASLVTLAGLAAANQIVGFFKDGITKFQVNK